VAGTGRGRCAEPPLRGIPFGHSRRAAAWYDARAARRITLVVAGPGGAVVMDAGFAAEARRLLGEGLSRKTSCAIDGVLRSSIMTFIAS
jgi:hypothetical protein